MSHGVKIKSLADKMREKAKGHPRSAELMATALALDEAVNAAYGVDGPPKDAFKKFIGAWARARLLWRDVTGEPLIEEGRLEVGVRLLTLRPKQ